MMTNGVDFSASPGGLVSATHGERELEDTIAALRQTVHMLKQEGDSYLAAGLPPFSLEFPLNRVISPIGALSVIYHM